MLHRQVTYRFVDALRRIERGTLHVTTPDGRVHHIEGRRPGVLATLAIHDWRTAQALAVRGDIGLAESYRDGWWESPDPAAFFQLGLENEAALQRYIYGSSFGRACARFLHGLRANTLRGSRRNILAHYDLGNAFYQLWLDPGMTYSSALFLQPGDTLSTAQDHKYDRILSHLSERGRLLEIGCGWGGFAERATASRDYEITGLTLSDAQHEYARARLGEKANIALRDYRAQDGKYDHIVSIEMFEAVGEQYWPVYFRKLKSLLARSGKAVVQTITIRDEYFDAYRRGGDAIRAFVFPGGMLPSPQRFIEESAKAGLLLRDRFAFGQDYARTLDLWRQRFDDRLAEVRALGFDEAFIRMWRFYLNACIASFRVGRTDVMQMELQHAA